MKSIVTTFEDEIDTDAEFERLLRLDRISELKLHDDEMLSQTSMAINRAVDFICERLGYVDLIEFFIDSRHFSKLCKYMKLLDYSITSTEDSAEFRSTQRDGKATLTNCSIENKDTIGLRITLKDSSRGIIARNITIHPKEIVCLNGLIETVADLNREPSYF